MSIEGYAGNYTNNLEGLNSEALLQSQIDTISYNITDITFNGVDTTNIDNNLSLSNNKILSITNYPNVKTTLDTLNSSISTINTTLSGITYTNNTGQDLTTIDNNVTINKVLSLPSYSNVKTTLDTINTTLSGISYTNNTGQDLTTIDNNLTIGTGKVLNIEGYSNVKTTLDSLTATLTDISYTSGTDTTTINNNLTLSTGKVLNIEGYSNVKTALDTITATLTDISYTSGTDTTTINNNLTLSTGKVLNIEGYSNVKTTLDSLTATLTDISYTSGTDTTTINNNLTLSTGKVLNIEGYSNVKTTLDTLNSSISTINTTLSGISYTSGTDTTTIDNNLTINKVLAIPSYSNVKTTLDSLTASINSITTITPMSVKIWEDEFFDGYNGGAIKWNHIGGGASNNWISEENHIGLIRLSVGAGDNRTMFPLQAPTITNFYWNNIVKMELIYRINASNNNFKFMFGISNSTAPSTSNKNILWGYDKTLAPSSYYYMMLNGDTIQFGQNDISHINGNWYHAVIYNLGGKILRFYLKNLDNNDTRDWTNQLPLTVLDATIAYYPIVLLTNTDSVAKNMDVDYISITYQTNRS